MRSVAAAPATFVFADIAGFTALTEAHGDEQAAELVAEFLPGGAGLSCRPAAAARSSRSVTR
jgi:hypothetical protein